jgi:hypothetical protein
MGKLSYLLRRRGVPARSGLGAVLPRGHERHLGEWRRLGAGEKSRERGGWKVQSSFDVWWRASFGRLSLPRRWREGYRILLAEERGREERGRSELSSLSFCLLLAVEQRLKRRKKK